MAAKILYVSLNQSFDPQATLAQIEPWAERAWALTIAKAMTCDRVVAVVQGHPVGAWRLRGAYPTDETYGDGQTRIGLSLGDPLPVLPEYLQVPALRRGIAVGDSDLPALPAERD